MDDEMKVAICLAVKNEKDDIPYWVAWHSSIGFDSFFIYNDQSSDSTNYVINSLKEKYDIRLRNVHNDRDDHVIRQVDIYNSCLDEAKREFDWLCFIDSDEYVYLDKGSVKSFLYQMPEDAGCVALNWCCFGTNGHLSRPEGPPLFSYKKHGKNTEYWNNHTKVIVKISKVKDEITYVHNAPVQGRTLTSDGKDVIWTTVFGGFTASSPNWENARLLHFQTRSLENYIKRYKDMEIHRKQNTSDPVHDVMNSKLYDTELLQIDDKIKNKYIDELLIMVNSQLKYIEKIMKETSILEIISLSSRFDLSKFESFFPSRAHKSHQIETKSVSIHNSGGIIVDGSVNVLRLTSHTGSSFFIGNNRQITTDSDCQTELFGLYIQGTRYIHFVAADQGRIFIPNDSRIATLLTYEVWQNPNGSISFSHPRTKKYLSVEGDGNIVVDRKRAWEWEWFDFEIINDEVKEIGNNFIGVYNISSIYNYIYLENFDHKYIINYISMLPDHERIALDFMCGNIFGEHIF